MSLPQRQKLVLGSRTPARVFRTGLPGALRLERSQIVVSVGQKDLPQQVCRKLGLVCRNLELPLEYQMDWNLYAQMHWWLQSQMGLRPVDQTQELGSHRMQEQELLRTCLAQLRVSHQMLVQELLRKLRVLGCQNRMQALAWHRMPGQEYQILQTQESWLESEILHQSHRMLPSVKLTLFSPDYV
jgi:hypothetical protein